MRPFDAADQTLAVECYSGYKGDERPVRFRISGAEFEIDRILDRWYTPEGACFRVRAGGAIFILRCFPDSGAWTLEPCPACRKRDEP
jgi:hypothetical protein